VKFLEGTEKKAEIFTEFVPDDLFKGETDKVESPRYVGIQKKRFRIKLFRKSP
jgi:hypothetical protein